MLYAKFNFLISLKNFNFLYNYLKKINVYKVTGDSKLEQKKNQFEYFANKLFVKLIC